MANKIFAFCTKLTQQFCFTKLFHIKILISKGITNTFHDGCLPKKSLYERNNLIHYLFYSYHITYQMPKAKWGFQKSINQKEYFPAFSSYVDVKILQFHHENTWSLWTLSEQKRKRKFTSGFPSWIFLTSFALLVGFWLTLNPP